LKNNLLLVFQKFVLFWIQKASVNMTARFSVKNSHIEYDLILVLKKQTTLVKVITVRLKFTSTSVSPACAPRRSDLSGSDIDNADDQEAATASLIQVR
jgi:hypothetical protein